MRSGRVLTPEHGLHRHAHDENQKHLPHMDDGGGGNDLPYVVVLRLLAPIPV